jgi:hypothetical protein
MNLVDLADQLRGYYSPERHTFRTWMPLFFFLLFAAVIDASILWILTGNERTKTSGTFKFRKLLANQFLSHTTRPNWTQPTHYSPRQQGKHESKVQSIRNRCDSSLNNLGNVLLARPLGGRRVVKNIN